MNEQQRLFVFYCKLDRPEPPVECGRIRTRFLLQACQEFAASRGFPPEALTWLGERIILKHLKFEVRTERARGPEE